MKHYAFIISLMSFLISLLSLFYKTKTYKKNIRNHENNLKYLNELNLKDFDNRKEQFLSSESPIPPENGYFGQVSKWNRPESKPKENQIVLILTEASKENKKFGAIYDIKVAIYQYNIFIIASGDIFKSDRVRWWHELPKEPDEF